MRTHRNGSFIHRTLTVAAVLAVALAGCGSDDGDDQATATAAPTEAATSPAATPTETMAPTATETMSDDMTMGEATDDMTMDDDMDMDMSGDYGEPADASEADRVIEVNVDNDLAFEPADFEVAAGEVITFRITNTGAIEHEFVLGDEEAQEEMAEMMASGDDHAHSGDMSNAVTIHADETAELTWRFTTPGTVLIGCHVPGHYEAGMTGTVTVTE